MTDDARHNRLPHIPVGREGAVWQQLHRKARRRSRAEYFLVSFIGLALLAGVASWAFLNREGPVKVSPRVVTTNPSHISVRNEITTTNLERFTDAGYMAGALGERRIALIKRAASSDLGGNLQRSENVFRMQLNALESRHEAEVVTLTTTVDGKGKVNSEVDLQELRGRFETQKQHLVREHRKRDASIRRRISSMERTLVESAATDSKVE